MGKYIPKFIHFIADDLELGIYTLAWYSIVYLCERKPVSLYEEKAQLSEISANANSPQNAGVVFHDSTAAELYLQWIAQPPRPRWRAYICLPRIYLRTLLNPLPPPPPPPPSPPRRRVMKRIIWTARRSWPRLFAGDSVRNASNMWGERERWDSECWLRSDVALVKSIWYTARLFDGVCVCVVVVFLSWLPKISRSLSVLKSCAARHYLYALLLRRNFIFYWIWLWALISAERVILRCACVSECVFLCAN